jgi:photosystem II stability/assembly factor-like uncharacterized protein
MMHFRVVLAGCLCFLAVAGPARATDLRFMEDATLHAIQFVNADEGWAVGDEGVVLRTVDGGKTWDRQPTGTRASLRSLCFLSAEVGWIAGREELPQGGSVGVLLYTNDSGGKWHRVLVNALPGLNKIVFLDGKTGFLLGDGAEHLPSGLFRTTDSGRSWRPVPGPRVPSWLDGDFQDADTGALTGAWSHLSILRQGGVIAADVDPLGGRHVRAIRLLSGRAVAVGDGGLVLTSKTGGKGWGYVDLKLPADILGCLDFQAIGTSGSHVWLAGRPGSLVLHSPDQGWTWELQKTAQSLPLCGVFFRDARQGWAVGALGTILKTEDGGKSWTVLRQGGKHSSLLFVHAQSQDLPIEVLARLGLEEGYLIAGVRVAAPDWKSAGVAHALDGQRFAAAVRRAGGADGEQFWQFPLPQHLDSAAQTDLMDHWNSLHGKRAADQMLRQLVLAVRVWRPLVVCTDNADAKKANGAAGALVAEAVQQACKLAADPQAFPEQLEVLGLETWKVSRVFSLLPGRGKGDVSYDGNELLTRLCGTPRDFTAALTGLLGEPSGVSPTQRFFRLVKDNLSGVGGPQHLMSGLELRAEQGARRSLGEAQPPDEKLVKAMQTRRQLEAFADNPVKGLTDPDKLLADLGRALEKLPPDQGAAAAFALARHHARAGQWMLAQEMFLTLVNHYPTHPLAAEAYRWLVQHNTSSEVRRRYELKQFKLVSHARALPPRMPSPEDLKSLLPKSPGPAVAPHSPAGQKKPKPGTALVPEEPGKFPLAMPGGAAKPSIRGTEVSSTSQLTYLTNEDDTRRWLEASLEYAQRLACFGPLLSKDPALQFSLQSARRQLGQLDKAQTWYRNFKSAGSPQSPWRDVAAAEAWLVERGGPPPRPLLQCRYTSTRPFLDGQFDDPCWQNVKPAVLQNAVGDTTGNYRTEVRLAYDPEFLYIALSCTHPPASHVAPARERPRDANLDAFDRVSLLLDLDRDYATYFHLQVDQRGCVCEDCWGDRTWNPRWFVALRSTQTKWNVEAAIPLRELTGQKVSLGTVWACNVVRILPGHGVQAWSLPANVRPRPEGMGLLLFQDEVGGIRPAAHQQPAGR